MKKFGAFAILLILVLTAIEILKVYFIMPFPGSQEDSTINLAYSLHNSIWWIRIIGWALLLYFILKLKPSKLWVKIVTAVVFAFYGLVFYMFNFKFLADKMFYQPETKTMASVETNKIPLENVVLGIDINGEARAYPLQLIGYHHQVLDTVNGEPIMVTYCTVCRTGRVYSPKVNGKQENFRLVGMDHFNAMFEDETTHSWWRQVNGEAIAGDLKGTQLEELRSQQTTLKSWIEKHPNTLVMQPDEKFKKQYADLEGYGIGEMKEADNKLEGKNTESWQRKSWVVGLEVEGASKAYDWNALQQKHIISDTLKGQPLLVILESDGNTFHVFNRRLNDTTVLDFTYNTGTLTLSDKQTQSIWGMDGSCTEGELNGKKLQPIQAYQEFWHSWQTFHPHTSKY